MNVKPVVNTLFVLLVLGHSRAYCADTNKSVKRTAGAKPVGVSPVQAKAGKEDVKSVEKTIKTHTPAKGGFQNRRKRIFEAIKREYEEKKDVKSVLGQYLQMDESVSRGTNWIEDDSGNYHRMRPLSVQCKELEDSLNLSPEFGPK